MEGTSLHADFFIFLIIYLIKVEGQRETSKHDTLGFFFPVSSKDGETSCVNKYVQYELYQKFDQRSLF